MLARLIHSACVFGLITSASLTAGTKVQSAEQLSSLSTGTSKRHEFLADEIKVPPLAPKVIVLNQPLPKFLQVAAKRGGYTIDVSKKVRGTLNGIELPADLRQILPRLSSIFRLGWHYEETSVFVVSLAEVMQRKLQLGQMQYGELLQAMAQSGTSSDLYTVTYLRKEHSVSVYGSPAFIGKINELVEAHQLTGLNTTPEVAGDPLTYE